MVIDIDQNNMFIPEGAGVELGKDTRPSVKSVLEDIDWRHLAERIIDTARLAAVSDMLQQAQEMRSSPDELQQVSYDVGAGMKDACVDSTVAEAEDSARNG